MLRRTGFKRPTLERTRTVHKPVPAHLRRNASMGPLTRLVAAPKHGEYRNRALLDMARDRDCLLGSPACPHSGDTSTTVACHSNQGKHGKAGAMKADDHYSVWGCWYCHSWLDQGHADKEAKVAVFDAAMLRQIEAWRLVAADPSEPERLRRAATWALELHA